MDDIFDSWQSAKLAKNIYMSSLEELIMILKIRKTTSREDDLNRI
jgi:hypothetical protein